MYDLHLSQPGLRLSTLPISSISPQTRKARVASVIYGEPKIAHYSTYHIDATVQGEIKRISSQCSEFTSKFIYVANSRSVEISSLLLWPKYVISSSSADDIFAISMRSLMAILITFFIVVIRNDLHFSSHNILSLPCF